MGTSPRKPTRMTTEDVYGYTSLAADTTHHNIYNKNADEVYQSLITEEIVDAVTGIGRFLRELVLYNTPIISVQFSC